jgi:hypothetical protein
MYFQSSASKLNIGRTIVPGSMSAMALRMAAKLVPTKSPQPDFSPTSAASFASSASLMSTSATLADVIALAVAVPDRAQVAAAVFRLTAHDSDVVDGSRPRVRTRSQNVKAPVGAPLLTVS